MAWTAILLSACTTHLPPPSPSEEAAEVPQATMSSLLPHPTSAPTKPVASTTPGLTRPTAVFYPETFPLSPGDYVAHSIPSSKPPGGDEFVSRDIILVDVNGIPLGTLASLPSDDWAISPDGHTLAYSAWQRVDLLDLRQGTRVTLPGFHGNIGSWSPDGLSLVTSELGEINIVPIASGERVPITRCKEWAPSYEADCSHPSWSPDGAFISFSINFSRSGPRDPLAGVYLLDTTCAFQIEACWANISGPLPFNAGYAWAPNGQTIAFPSNVWAPGAGIGFFSIAGQRIKGYIPDPWANGQTATGSIAWSPDGSRIATSWGRIIDLASGSEVATFEASPDGRIQWVHIPEPSPNPPGA